MRAVDLFAGAGGFSLGVEQAGYHVEHAIEVDEWACETLESNHVETRVTPADIRTLSDEWFKREVARYPDLLVGGPPCQGFSHAGPRVKDPKDPRNSLFREFVRVAAILEPAAVVLENVPGLLRAKTAEGASVAGIIEEELRILGYSVSRLVLDAHQFGVPQIRRRVFFVGLGDGAPPTSLSATHASGSSLFDLSLLPVVTLRDAISDLPAVDVGRRESTIRYVGPPQNGYQRQMREGAGEVLSNHVPMRHSQRMIERFKAIKPGQSQTDVVGDHAPRMRVRATEEGPAAYDQNNRRMYWDRPCHTLAASFYANFVHPSAPRNFTPREGARIQIPDRYVFKGKPTVVSDRLLAREGRHLERHLCQYNQIGNAVPPLLGHAVVSAVRDLVNASARTDEAIA